MIDYFKEYSETLEILLKFIGSTIVVLAMFILETLYMPIYCLIIYPFMYMLEKESGTDDI